MYFRVFILILEIYHPLDVSTRYISLEILRLKVHLTLFIHLILTTCPNSRHPLGSQSVPEPLPFPVRSRVILVPKPRSRAALVPGPRSRAAPEFLWEYIANLHILHLKPWTDLFEFNFASSAARKSEEFFISLAWIGPLVHWRRKLDPLSKESLQTPPWEWLPTSRKSLLIHSPPSYASCYVLCNGTHTQRSRNHRNLNTNIVYFLN